MEVKTGARPLGNGAALAGPDWQTTGMVVSLWILGQVGGHILRQRQSGEASGRRCAGVGKNM
ncbi:MAG TPA: hypothetical protein VGR47_18505 [Terracidiphilus sp.]|nr:hypothetical protein [Terracidiphilus sp.]